MKYLVLALSVAASAAQAQYRCAGNVYQQEPCAGGRAVVVPGRMNPDAEVRDAKYLTAIAARQVIVGMTTAEVVRSWGPPNAINRTVTERSTYEQWVYERGSISQRQYVYLDNGVVRSFQTPE